MSKILIAGLGSIGKRHLRNLLSLGCSDIVLFRTRPAPVEDAPGLPVFTDFAEALAQRPDVVMVCTPTAQHVPYALAALKAGIPLFLEKPVSHTWDGVDDLLQAARAAKVMTMVGFDLRFDPGLLVARELIDQGALGKVVMIQAQVGQYLPDWRPHEDYRKGMSARLETGGGVILDLIHELDYVSWLGGAVAKVACFAGRYSSLELETEDAASIALEFADGGAASVCLDYVQRAPSRTCRVIGEKGSVFWDYFGNRVSWYLAEKKTWQEKTYADFQRNDRFVAETKHMLACLGGSERPKVDLEAACQTLKIALAAKESAAKGVICPIR